MHARLCCILINIFMCFLNFKVERNSINIGSQFIIRQISTFWWKQFWQVFRVQ